MLHAWNPAVSPLGKKHLHVNRKHCFWIIFLLWEGSEGLSSTMLVVFKRRNWNFQNLPSVAKISPRTHPVMPPLKKSEAEAPNPCHCSTLWEKKRTSWEIEYWWTASAGVISPIWLSLIKWTPSLNESWGYPRQALLVSPLFVAKGECQSLAHPNMMPNTGTRSPQRWSPLSAWVTAELKGYNVSGLLGVGMGSAEDRLDGPQITSAATDFAKKRNTAKV